MVGAPGLIDFLSSPGVRRAFARLREVVAKLVSRFRDTATAGRCVITAS